ncbi:MAG: PDZ domain-containing protein [Acidobacteria bacterium]|nr:PDZ domain-containing protein [Acidobacteriota bacterium]
MQKFLETLDEFAGIATGSAIVVWLERAAFVFLIIMLAAAPHSIAATQTAWITGMFLWVVRLFFRPRVKLRFGALDYVLWGFFAWSTISSFLSYEPAVSLDRLRGAALFLIVYFVLYNLRNLRAVYFAAGVLIFSCMVNVCVTVVDRAVGRGVAVHGLRPDSPLAKAGLLENDAVFKVNDKKVSNPDDLAAALSQTLKSRVRAYRKDYEVVVDLERANILPGTTAMEQIGFANWGRTRNWRASGFYGHYTTYAEVLQLIASLALGLLVAGFFSGRKPKDKPANEHRPNIAFADLLVSVAGMAVALLLTVTRASQLGLLVSGLAIFILGASRRWLILAFAVGIPTVLIGLFILQQSREVGFFDPNDLSTQYRQMMWNDGVRLWTESPRRLIVGVGMDSIQKHWQEWQMFDKGWQPMGHFHSTPIQLLAERGLPALIFWLAILGIYVRKLFRGLNLRGRRQNPAAGSDPDWRSTGILLGCLGGTVGFFTSGLVHYNLGDQEVAMVFYVLIGIGLKVCNSGDGQRFDGTVAG